MPIRWQGIRKGMRQLFGIGAAELVIILVLALVIFGPGKLPEVGRAIGRSVREFKKATSLDDSGAPSTTSSDTADASASAATSVQNSE